MDRTKAFSIGKTSYSYAKSEAADHSALNENHCHDFYEILYVIDGKGKFMIEGTEYPVNPHTLLVIPPFEYHRVDIDARLNYERCVIHFFESELLPECKEFLNSFRKEDGVFYVASISSPAVIAQFEQLEFSDSVPEHGRPLHMKMALSALVLLLSVTSRDPVSRDSEELGARVIRYLNDHIDKDVSLDFLAKRFFVSKYYLCRAFKKYNGISVHGYVNQKRVMYAKSLIESGETASGAAYRVGFGDYSAFYRAYVKIVGKSPTA